jgi:hypothetical protein
MKTSSICLSSILLLLGALVWSARGQTPLAVNFPADSRGQISFVMPSKNIGCTFTPQGGTAVYQPFDGGPELSCDRIKPQYVRLVVTPKTVRRFDDVGDQDCCGVDNVIAYGSRWTQGPFICESADTGLTCRHSSGRGFSVSREGIRVF